MSYLNFVRGGVSIAALCVTGSMASADVSAQEVWESLQEQMSLGQVGNITVGSSEMSGSTLTVTDVEITMTAPTGTTTNSLGTLEFTENGDGTVTMTLLEGFSVSSVASDPTLGGFEMTGSLPGNSTLVSGTPESMLFDFTADRYSMVMSSTSSDESAPPFNATVNLNNVASQYTMNAGDIKTLVGTMSADGFDILMDGESDGTATDITGQSTGLSASFDMSIPENMNTDDPASMFENGYAVDFALNSTASAYVVNSTDEMGMTTISSTATDGRFAVDFDADGAAFDFGGKALAILATGGQIPFPVDFGLSEYGMALTMPLSKTEEPAPFSVALNLIDLSVNDMIWGMFDPAAILPHDPATLQIDMSGTAKMLFDMMNPEDAMAAEMAQSPGELHSLKLNTLKLAFAGALLTGDGDFTFDNADTETFPGMPRPQGVLNLAASGVNGLMDKLVQMGLVPEDQIMGARMMMGMFSTVVGDDQLTSKIEVTADGQVMANDQRIR